MRAAPRVHVPRLTLGAAGAVAGARAAACSVTRTSTSAARASSRSGWRSAAACRRPWPARRGRRWRSSAPAVIEAREARVPLLVLSADRPAELRENGAGQAIDQLKLFGSAAKWFFEVSLDGGAGPQQLRFIRTLACRAYWTALQGRPGAVHLNFPLREPLVVRRGAARRPQRPSRRAPLYAPHGCRARPRPPPSRSWADWCGEARRGVLVAGRDERGDGLGRWPPRVRARGAGGRCWPTRCQGPAAAGGDGPLRHAAARRPLRRRARDRTWCCGSATCRSPSRCATGWPGSARPSQVALDPEGAWQDPSSVVGRSLALEPAGVLERLAALGAGGRRAGRRRAAGRGGGWRTGAGPTSWRRVRWRRCSTAHALCEPAVAAELGTLLPDEATLFVASSMPVRDIESFWAVREDPPRVLCNRGANGIDGTVSSAFGAAAAGAEPVVLLIGDVALAHDIGGLLAARRLGIALTIVLSTTRAAGSSTSCPSRGSPERGGSTTPTWRRPPAWTSATRPSSTACTTSRWMTSTACAARWCGAAGAAHLDRRGAHPAGGQRRRCTGGSGRRRARRSARKQREQGLQLDLGLGQLARRVGVADDPVAGVAARFGAPQ